MHPTNLALLVFTVVIGGALLFMTISIWNGLIELRNQVDRSWSNIDVILKQRHDEIPHLLLACERFSGFESATLERLKRARECYQQASAIRQKVKAASEVTSALHAIFRVADTNSEMQSNPRFLEFQHRISRLEDLISDRRDHFNETVTHFNSRIAQMPDLFVARFLGYTAHVELFKVRDSERVLAPFKMKVSA